MEIGDIKTLFRESQGVVHLKRDLQSGEEGLGICDYSTKALVIESVTMGGEGVQNCVTSFMDAP
jgi:hypothetical protein